MRAMLGRQGIKLKEINEYNILKEFMLLTEKESLLRQSLKNTRGS